MYSQNDKNGVLEVIEIKTLFTVRPWWTDLLIKNFFKILFADFTLAASLQGYWKR